MFTRHLHTQKTVLGKNDPDGYECKYERSSANLTVLSVRFIFLSKVQSFLSFDGRCALCFGKTRHIASTLPSLSRYSHLITRISAFRETNKYFNY